MSELSTGVFGAQDLTILVWCRRLVKIEGWWPSSENLCRLALI